MLLTVPFSKKNAILNRACYDMTTSNLHSHVVMCNAVAAHDDVFVAIAANLPGSTYSPERLRALIDIWLASSSRPFALVNDAGFQDILHMFDRHVSIPSDHTISRDIREMYFIVWENLARFLEVCYFSCCSLYGP